MAKEKNEIINETFQTKDDKENVIPAIQLKHDEEFKEIEELVHKVDQSLWDEGKNMKELVNLMKCNAPEEIEITKEVIRKIFVHKSPSIPEFINKIKLAKEKNKILKDNKNNLPAIQHMLDEEFTEIEELELDLRCEFIKLLEHQNIKESDVQKFLKKEGSQQLENILKTFKKVVVKLRQN